MAIYPAFYRVSVTGSANDSDKLTDNGYGPFFQVWAFSQHEALQKARREIPAGHRIIRVERND